MLRELQQESDKWRLKNFGKTSPTEMLLGISEELGELAHAQLKEIQNIRLNEDHLNDAKDAVGDIVIFLCGYCSSRNWSIEEVTKESWKRVSKRDWIKFPINGRDE